MSHGNPGPNAAYPQPRRGGTPAGVEEPGTAEGTHAGAEESGKGDASVLTELQGTSVSPTYMYELRWALTGTLIKVCIGHGDVSVEELEQQLEEGYFEEYGVPRATDDNGDWLDWHYTLMYGTRKLSVGQLFSDYSIPLHGATINVIKESTDGGRCISHCLAKRSRTYELYP